MGYTAVRGGVQAILAAERLVVADRRRGLRREQVRDGARLLVDQVMGEGGLYDEELAALAIAQAEGDPIEAAFLLRAYRSTLPRLGYTLPASGSRMRATRRISAAFKDVPGGQVLGRTRDYMQRLLRVDGAHEPADIAPDEEVTLGEPPWFPSVVEVLREAGVVPPPGESSEQPFDLTREALRLPAPRSARLQALSRGETGFMVGVAYSAMRGFGVAHPVIGELRCGELPVQILHPLTGDPVTVGSVRATEVQAINHSAGGMGGMTLVSGVGEDGQSPAERFDLGYGFAFGRHERKAIAMAILDMSLSISGNTGQAADEELVLLHCDGLESSGFVEHLKMPHYVTFQSALDRVRFRRLAQLERAGAAASRIDGVPT